MNGRGIFSALMLVSLGLATPAAAADKRGPLQRALGASDDWTISGSVRARLEGIDDQFRPAPAARADRFLSFRTLLFAEYHPGPVRIGAELFDSRGYLEANRSTIGTTEINALEIGQAYVGVPLDGRLGRGSTASLTLGRFTMDIGARRLFARNQFRNTINSFTGARFDWKGRTGDAVRLFWTMPQYRLPDDRASIRDNAVHFDRESTDLQAFGGVVTTAGVAGGTLELYGFGIAERDSARVATRDRHLFTPGFRVARAPAAAKADWDVEAAYQFGHARATTAATDTRDLDVSAWLLHAEAGHSFATHWAPRVVVQLDVASGDRRNPATFNRFDTLFGARRGEFGPTSLWGLVQRSNLVSPALRLEATPDTRWDGFVAWRPLWLQSRSDSFAASGVRDPAARSGRFAGHQIEGRVRHWLVPKILRLDGGAALLLKGNFLRDAPNAPATGDSRYAYLDLTVSF